MACVFLGPVLLALELVLVQLHIRQHLHLLRIQIVHLTTLIVGFRTRSLLVRHVLGAILVHGHVVLGHLGVGEVCLVHLHWMNGHLHHTAATVRRCPRVGHTTELLPHYVHLHSHPMQVHVLEVLHLVVYHIVHRRLALPPALL